MSLRPLVACLAVAILALPGCSDDQPTGGSNSTAVRRPGTGSSFTFEISGTRDGAPSQSASLTYTAGASGIEVNGRKNVVMYGVTPRSPFLDTIPMSYDDNGDISVESSSIYLFNDVLFNVTVWSPLASANTEPSRTLFTFDSTAEADGDPIGLRVSRTAKYLGREQQTVGGTALETHRVAFMREEISTGASPSSTRQFDTAWFAPSIGMYTRLSIQRVDSSDGRVNRGTEVHTLTGFTLK